MQNGAEHKTIVFVEDEGHAGVQVLVNAYLSMHLVRYSRSHPFSLAFPKHYSHGHEKYSLAAIFRVPHKP